MSIFKLAEGVIKKGISHYPPASADALAEAVLKMKRALEYYGDKKNWYNYTIVLTQGSYVCRNHFPLSDVGDYDENNQAYCGEMARKCLKELNNDRSLDA